MELMVSVDLARSWFGPSSGSIDGLHFSRRRRCFCPLVRSTQATPARGSNNGRHRKIRR